DIRTTGAQFCHAFEGKSDRPLSSFVRRFLRTWSVGGLRMAGDRESAALELDDRRILASKSDQWACNLEAEK
ncbi:MAG: hypothetical protein ABEJ89_01010, partial [Haloarculaceae archaeon]